MTETALNKSLCRNGEWLAEAQKAGMSYSSALAIVTLRLRDSIGAGLRSSRAWRLRRGKTSRELLLYCWGPMTFCWNNWDLRAVNTNLENASVLGRWMIKCKQQEERVFVYFPFSWCIAKQVKHLWEECASGTPSYSDCSWVSSRLHSSPCVVISCLFITGKAGSEEQGLHLQVLLWQKTLRIDSGNIKRQKWKWE